MSEKTKKILERCGWIATAAGVVSLFICGVSQDEVTQGIALIDVAVTAIGAALAYIFGKMKSKK